MSREDGKGKCMCCGKQFGYYLIHSGFNESAYAYCDQCGETCLLDLWRLPSTVERMDQGIIPESLEPLLAPCKCGGAFRKEATPRCPNCNSNLSAERAGEFLEANATGTEKGWRWQRNWDGVYCIVISNRTSKDCWRRDVER